MEAYVHGVSTRKVDDLVAALGIDAGISKSEVSRNCAELDGVVATFRDRPLGHTSSPYVFLDATVRHEVPSGRPSCARSGRVAWPASGSSSATPTKA